jgi:hypothetical protein
VSIRCEWKCEEFGRKWERREVIEIFGLKGKILAYCGRCLSGIRYSMIYFLEDMVGTGILDVTMSCFCDDARDSQEFFECS